MDGRPAVVVEDLRSLELGETSQPAYDRPFGIRLLHEDPATGAEHYLVRYPPGLVARRHRHTAAHTVLVLEGRLSANGRVVGPASYVHFPAGEPMHHGPADGQGCLFVLMFDRPFDLEVLD
jgi:quercetin dioxygenase-like cupin family protein